MAQPGVAGQRLPTAAEPGRHFDMGRRRPVEVREHEAVRVRVLGGLAVDGIAERDLG